MECPKASWLCSITVLLGAALLLPASRSTQALSIRQKDPLAAEQDLAEGSMLGIQAVELPVEDKISEEEKQGIEVISSSAWARQGPQVQVEPEEDRDHFHHHPQDDVRELNARRPPHMLSQKVENGPEKDLDYLRHS